MNELQDLLNNNRVWAESIEANDPEFFQKLAGQQKPRYLWIGCSDSRVPANQIIGLMPGEVFVHRNVANLVHHSDLNVLSVIQFAVDVLKVEHIIVCGHYGCGGVHAALKDEHVGLVDNWIRSIRELYQILSREIDSLPEDERGNRLCEVNVKAQVYHVSQTTIVKDAWARGQKLAVHGLVYGLQDGRIHDLNVSLNSAENADAVWPITPSD